MFLSSVLEILLLFFASIMVSVQGKAGETAIYLFKFFMQSSMIFVLTNGRAASWIKTLLVFLGHALKPRNDDSCLVFPPFIIILRIKIN